MVEEVVWVDYGHKSLTDISAARYNPFFWGLMYFCSKDFEFHILSLYFYTFYLSEL